MEQLHQDTRVVDLDWNVVVPTIVITREPTKALISIMCSLEGTEEYNAHMYSGPNLDIPFATRQVDTFDSTHKWLRELIDAQSSPKARKMTLIMDFECYKWHPLIFKVIERYQELKIRVLIFATDDVQLTNEIHYGRDLKILTLATDVASINAMRWRQKVNYKKGDQLFMQRMVSEKRIGNYSVWHGIDVPECFCAGDDLRPYTCIQKT